MSSKRGRWWSALLILVAAAVTIAAFVATGGAANSEPGGTLSATGTMTDRSTGQVFQFTLNANEDTTQAGIGSTFFQLDGPGITACDVHGGPATTGNSPLGQCGGSSGVSVRVDDCKAIVETHGAVHSDHPWTVFLGPVVLDATFTYNPRQADGELVIELYTPKDVIKIAGPTNAVVVMPTCT